MYFFLAIKKKLIKKTRYALSPNRPYGYCGRNNCRMVLLQAVNMPCNQPFVVHRVKNSIYVALFLFFCSETNQLTKYSCWFWTIRPSSCSSSTADDQNIRMRYSYYTFKNSDSRAVLNLFSSQTNCIFPIHNSPFTNPCPRVRFQ